ncbi:MAG: long-subunit fatty acid transport protein, partial [Myxococcota bacterium]
MASSRLHGLCAALIGVLTASASPAHGSTFEIFGNTPRDIGMGGAMTAATRGYSALFYNPGALTVGHEQRLGIGLTLTAPSLFVERERPDGDRPTELPGTHVGLSLGWVKSVPGIFEKKLAVGASLYVPLDELLRVQGIDPQSPQFYLYQNLQDKMILDLGLAYEPVEWFSFGLAVQILADLGGSSTLRLDLANTAFDQREFGVSVLPSASLIAGIHARPSEALSIGLTYRGSNSLDFTLPVIVTEGESLQLVLDVSQTVLWTPDVFALGVSILLDEPRLRLALDLSYALWSAAPDPSPRLSVDLGGRLLESFGLQDALDLSTRAKRIELGFSDTLTPRVGAEWTANDWLTLRTGY